MSKNKLYKRKYILASICLLLFVTVAFVFILYEQKSKPDPISKKVILEAAAKQLNKDPNKLTDEDFAQITELTIGTNNYPPTITELSDIKALEKFPNLGNLKLQVIQFSEKDIPIWMSFLNKLFKIDFSDRLTIELKVLERLNHLKSLSILNMPIKNLNAFKSLNNLENLEIYSTPVTELDAINGLANLKSLKIGFNEISNIEALRGLVNLQELYIESTPISDIEPISNLSNLKLLHLFNTPITELRSIKNLKNIQSFYCSNTKIKDIEPIRNLTNLKRLELQSVDISDINPIKELKYLETFTIFRCQYITDEQIEDLQKALPNLKIQR